MLLGAYQKLLNALLDVSVGEDEYIMPAVSSHKLHGIHVDKTPSWKTHITHLCPKLQGGYIYLTKLST